MKDTISLLYRALDSLRSSKGGTGGEGGPGTGGEGGPGTGGEGGPGTGGEGGPGTGGVNLWTPEFNLPANP